MRIIIAGSGQLGLSILKPLLQSQHEIVGAAFNGRRKSRWQRRFTETFPLWTRGSALLMWEARNERIPIVWLDRLDEDECARIRSLKPDLLITCGFSLILNRPILAIPRIGCINVHSSLLPKHRGPSPFAHVILANKRRSGVTFHVTTEDIDAGPIVDQVAFPLDPRENGMSLYEKCCAAAGNRVLTVVRKIEARGLVGSPQNPDEATYDPKFTEFDARIDWTRSAEAIDRLVRAAYAYQGATCGHRGRILTVMQTTFRSEPVSVRPGTVLAVDPCPTVATGEGTLTLVEVRYPTTFARSFGRRGGLTIGDVLE